MNGIETIFVQFQSMEKIRVIVLFLVFNFFPNTIFYVFFFFKLLGRLGFSSKTFLEITCLGTTYHGQKDSYSLDDQNPPKND